MLSSPQPLLRELDHALPDRPFAVRLWDGSTLPATNGGGPTFEVRSPDALAHALLSPGQLGLSRAYVSGALDVEGLDEVMPFLDTWKPPPLPASARARLALAAARPTCRGRRSASAAVATRPSATRAPCVTTTTSPTSSSPCSSASR